jgi:hypothetical protein
MTSTLDISVSLIAAIWLSARARPICFSTHGKALSGSIQGHGSVPFASRVSRSRRGRSRPRCGPTSETTLRDALSAARAIGLEIQVLNSSTSREINAAFATFVRERSDALFVDIDPFFTTRRMQLVHLASHQNPRHVCVANFRRSRQADELRE